MADQLQLRPYQQKSIKALRQGIRDGHRCQILCSPTGSGKCLGKGTPILMADGTIKAVEEVIVGDRLASPTGSPRTVLGLGRGRELMYRVTPTKGDSYIVNASHLLSLQKTPGSDGLFLCDGSKIYKNEPLVAVEAWVFAQSNATVKHCLKGWRSGVSEFDGGRESLLIPPYILGIWLGDGSSNLAAITKPEGPVTEAWIEYGDSLGLSCRAEDSNGTRCATWFLSSGRNSNPNPALDALRKLNLVHNKHIPSHYKTASIKTRLELIAGLLDTDGYADKCGYDWTSSNKVLAEDMAFLCRSVGLACYISKQRKGIKTSGFEGDYWRCSISGDCERIPCRQKIVSARQQKKRHLVHGITIEPIGEDDYYGFEIDGDRLFMLGDFTVTHNTIIGTFLLSEVQRKQTKAAFIVDRVALCDQTSKTLWQYGIQHGVAQSANTFGRSEKIQICSAQTIEKRGFWPGLDLLIVDECHAMRKKIIEFAKNINTPVIGLTATPFSKGLGETYSNVVNVTTTDALINDGFLAPLKVYIAKEIDMTGAKTRGGEWIDKDIEERGKAIVGDIVAEWEDKTTIHFGGPVKTIVFSATVDHGDELCRQFQAAGYNFQQISYKDKNDDHRKALIDEFRKPDSDIDGLVSCEALAKGFDVPDIQCGISARPYRKSFASHIQQIGRGMRSFPGKDYCLWLDHAGNYLGFYDEMLELFACGVSELDDGERGKAVRKERKKEQSELACHGCGYAPLLAVMDNCPSCGKARIRRNAVEIVPGKMVAIEGVDTSKHPHLKDATQVWRQLCCLGIERKKGDFIEANKFALAQYRNFYLRWPPKDYTFQPSEHCDDRLRSHVKSNLIRWAKSQQRRAA